MFILYQVNIKFNHNARGGEGGIYTCMYIIFISETHLNLSKKHEKLNGRSFWFKHCYIYWYTECIWDDTRLMNFIPWLHMTVLSIHNYVTKTTPWEKKTCLSLFNLFDFFFRTTGPNLIQSIIVVKGFNIVKTKDVTLFKCR